MVHLMAKCESDLRTVVTSNQGPPQPGPSHSLLRRTDMAESKYAYVRKFELPDVLLPKTYIILRLDGHAFHR